MRLLRTLAPVACLLAVVVTRPAPFAALSARAEQTLHSTLGDDHIFCRLYLEPGDKFTRVEGRQRSAMMEPGDKADSVLSNMQVTYSSGFTTAARTAFQAAVDIWSTQVQSNVPIVIAANFADLGNPNLLGSASSTCVFSNFAGAPRPSTWFPVVIANRLTGSDLLPAPNGTCTNAADISANFNSTATWYYGTDGLTPAGQVDFESVVLHELGHGLGFFGSATVSGANGSFGAVGFPFIYDVPVIDAPTGGNLLTSYPNNSPTLAAVLTGGSLYWDGTNGKTANGGTRPKLWAPATWSQGSSYSHLDDVLYPAGNINSLMTFQIASAESIHTPGPIMMGMFADMGWGVQTGGSCSFGLDTTSAAVAAAGVSGTTALKVTVSASAGCAWTASTASGFVSITSGTSGSGPGVVRMNVTANAGGGRSASVTIAGITYTINQAGTGPTMTLDKTALFFGVVNTGASFTSQTSTQAVRMTQGGVAGTVTWTAASNVPWLVVSPTSGTGSATLNISVQFASGLFATQNGNVTLTFTGAGNSPGPIVVTLKSLNSAIVTAPTGAFDTPIDGTTGVAGSIPVTGWAIDDIQVTRVRLLRDPVAGEPAGLVFIGDATFVDGARPDIAGLFPNSPRNTFGGWGYLLLTNFLPNLGNGTFRLTAIADDADGHSTVLGTKTITCTNNIATAPFGAIDTPAQGGTVSGSSVVNFGWVLGPNPRRADPPGGGTVRVVIDGGFLAQVPGGWNSRSDLSALFSASAFPGIGTALGVAVFDSTTMTNGVHTIQWLVTDNLGSAAGIGSRYFTVSNGALFLDPSESGAAAGSNVIAGSSSLAMPRAASLRLASAGALSHEVDAAPVDARAIGGRRGYDLETRLQAFSMRGGPAAIQAEELDRVELRLSESGGHTYTGYMRVNGGLAPLPIGSSLDAATGAFTWQPGVGFVGPYDLVFVRWAGDRAVARQDVRVVLNAKGSGRVGPQTLIDLADGTLVAGWAADLDSGVDTGVDTVHVWAYPADGSDPIFVGAADYGGARPDVAAVYGERFLKSGYGLRVRGLAPGTYDLAVFAYSTVKGGFVPAKTVRVTVR